MHNAKKHIILLAAALTAALSSCSDEPGDALRGDSSEYIIFNAPQVTMTASGSRSVIKNELDGPVAVYGYCVPREIGNNSVKSYGTASALWNLKSKYVTPHVFSNQTVNADGSYVKGGGLQPWEADNGYNAREFRYSFIAHYPASSESFTMNRTGDGNTSSSIGVPELTFNMPWNGGDVTTQRDHSQIDDLMYAAVFNHRKVDGQVGLRFNHLLTAFRFKINNYTGLKLIVKSVSLQGSFYRSATLNFETETPQRSEASGSFGATFPLLTAEQTIASQSSGEFLGASDDNDNQGVTIMLLPGLNTANASSFNYLGSDTHLIISYEVRNEQDNSIVGGPYNEVKAAFNPSSPKAGTRYAANLNFVGNEFVLIFTPESDNWDTGSDNDIVIN